MDMIRCVWEHNGDDTLMYAVDYPGAYARGASFEEAAAKLPREIAAYLRWAGIDAPVPEGVEVIEDAPCELNMRDADSDVIFAAEREPMTRAEYEALKELAMKSAADFRALYEYVPDKDATCLAPRSTFYGDVPVTARAMYAHTRQVNSYDFGEIGVDADNDGDIDACRARGFAALEAMPEILTRPACEGSYGEWWSLRKVLRRFIWHDRIHARAMYRMAKRTFGAAQDVFRFEG